jgi:hypothetical protein
MFVLKGILIDHLPYQCVCFILEQLAQFVSVHMCL